MASKCDNNILYASLEWCIGKPSYPGIRKRLYYISKRDIVSWPKLPYTSDKDADFQKLSTYIGNFTLAADAKWKYIDVTISKSPVTSETQGEPPSATSLNKATFVHPGTQEDATSFVRVALNDDYVYLIQGQNGKFRVLGNEFYETKTTVGQELGASVTDVAGTTINVEVSDICPAPFYPGTIITEDGNISGTDGAAATPE